MKLKELVRRELLETRLTYRALADRIGISYGTIFNVLQDAPPRSLTTLKKFAAYFKIDVAELLERGATKETQALYRVSQTPNKEEAGILATLRELAPSERDFLLRWLEDAVKRRRGLKPSRPRAGTGKQSSG